MWEVKPSAHYHMGGIKTNQYGQALDKHNQCIVGLYACGQALGGLHGSNRLGSTSLAEAVIFGLSAGQHAVQGAENRDFFDGESLCRIAKASIYQWSSGSEKDHTDTKHPIKLLRALQKHAWQYLGPVRNARGLKTFASIAENLQQEISVACIQGSLLYNQSLIDFFETRNLLLCARAIAICADTRTNSLGAHVRSDSNANPNRKQGSLAVFLDPATEQLQLHAEILQKSSSLTHWRVSGKQYLKSMLIHLVRKLPLNIRDVLLVKMYSKALGDYQ